MKHIFLKLFYPHELQQLSILQIKSCDNHADLFTKSLPLAIFDKWVKGIDMRRLRFARFRGRTPINNLDKMHHIVLCSFMSFTIISH
jgi:hypothetical protein